MMKNLLLLCCLLSGLNSIGQTEYSLDSYLADDPVLDAKVDSIVNTMNDTAIVAQLLMPAVGRLGSPENKIDQYAREGLIGGVLLLNGTRQQFEGWTKKYDAINEEEGHMPFLYSADAEPSLVNRKMIGSTKVPRANEIKTMDQLKNTTTTISNDLNEVGVNYNFAPVVDVAANKTVGYRGFGSNPKNIIPYSAEFIRITQEQNIIATAKHFPGHGLISGDTHASLQVINGELKELKNYPPLIDSGVLSIMVAHIAVKNNPKFNTNGAPATTSETIVTGLLRDSLNFEGLIVTDAMNMGGVAKVPQAAMKAIDAGCDIILMPLDVRKAHKNISEKYISDPEYKKKVIAATKRIIRMKICLGLIE